MQGVRAVWIADSCMGATGGENGWSPTSIMIAVARARTVAAGSLTLPGGTGAIH